MAERTTVPQQGRSKNDTLPTREPQAGEASEAFLDARESAVAQRLMMDKIERSPKSNEQRAIGDRLNNNPRMTLQRRTLGWSGSARPVIQQLTDRKVKAAVTKAGFTLETVNTWQTASGLSDSQIKDLLEGD